MYLMQDERRNPYRQFKSELIGDYHGKREIVSAERW